MRALSLSLLAVLLLTLAGCGEKEPKWDDLEEAPKTTENKFDADKFLDELSPEERFAYTQKEAEAGDAEAQFNLARMYETGEGVPTDSSKAVEVSAFGDPLLGNLTKAVEWYQKAAAQGHAYAQYNLGVMYAKGEGVPKDAVKAAEWLQKAAAQGDAKLQFSLGLMFANGNGIPKNAVKAIEWWEKAAAQGKVGAQFNLGLIYVNGKGVPKNAVKAFEWYKKAADQGYARAQSDLAAMYAFGKGIQKNNAKALELWKKAAAQGDADAQLNLGTSYAQGDGVPKDATKAAEWWLKAAAQGEAIAQVNLGWAYKSGSGVSKNIVLAYAWSNLAAAKDLSLAIKNRDLYEAQMTPAQRAEGQRLASNWKSGDTMLDTSGESSSFASSNGTLSKQGTGTAFAVSSEGHALTNHHVIKGCTEVKVAGREGVAKVITSDSVNDLALLQLPGKTSDIASLNPDLGKLRQGEDIIVFGYPLNFVLSSGGNLTPGTISALTGLGNNTNQLQITAAIQPGSSGSPVMDKKANVVGVVSMKLDDIKMARATGSVGQSVNFAVNGQTVKSFLDANKVPYKTGGGFFSREKNNADIAEEASKWTVLVECWK